MQFRPLHDRVLVRRIESEERTKGGILIPDTAKEKPMEGEVVAAGPGARGDDGKLQPMDVKAGLSWMVTSELAYFRRVNPPMLVRAVLL